MIVVRAFSISLDGYGAGPSQSLEAPMGLNSEGLHAWFRPTRTFQSMIGGEGGTGGVDDRFAEASMQNLGAWIMGRNMFGPIRGEWPDDSWRGWWGEEPPYHCLVFVLTHHPREPLAMDGAPFSTSSPKAWTVPWNWRAKPPASETSASAAAPPPSVRRCKLG